MAGPAHRNVSNIRPSITGLQSATYSGPSSPHTPLRTISSNFSSPSTLRAEEDCIVIELGSRFWSVGLGGDAVPKAIVSFGPEDQRRVGDYKRWEDGYQAQWRTRVPLQKWGDAHELYSQDMRDLDLGLVGDKIERGLRDAFSKYMLIDSRPRRMILALPTDFALPLLSAILDTLFNAFQPPTIALMSAPILTTASAGVRAATVVDLGWAETTVTSVYDYREISRRRSTRGSKLLSYEMMKLLAQKANPERYTTNESQLPPLDPRVATDLLAFASLDEVEDVVERVAWCRPRTKHVKAGAPGKSPTVADADPISAQLLRLEISGTADTNVHVPLSSTDPPCMLNLPFLDLAQPCEKTFFGKDDELKFDDEERPLPLLLYNDLLHLPVDVRSVCMSRIIFTGGAASIPGLKHRVLHELRDLVAARGWDGVTGKAAGQLKSKRNSKCSRSRQSNGGPVEVEHDSDGKLSTASTMPQEHDPIEAQLHRSNKKEPTSSMQGVIRAIESLGAWCGASLLCQLRVPAVAVVDCEQWLQHGLAGASKASDVSHVASRQSMGPGALRAGGPEKASWTLGAWK